jgi:hypothetical protein
MTADHTERCREQVLSVETSPEGLRVGLVFHSGFALLAADHPRFDALAARLQAAQRDRAEVTLHMHGLQIIDVE